jgi:hypothetical protein
MSGQVHALQSIELANSTTTNPIPTAARYTKLLVINQGGEAVLQSLVNEIEISLRDATSYANLSQIAQIYADLVAYSVSIPVWEETLSSQWYATPGTCARVAVRICARV